MIYRSLLFCQLFVLLVYYFTTPLDNYNDNQLLFLLTLSGVNLIVFLINRPIRKHKKANFLSIFFLLGYCIVFFQRYVDIILGYTSISSALFASPTTILKCAMISTIGLLAFMLGYSYQFKNIKNNKKEPTFFINTKPLKVLLFISTILFVLFNYEILLSKSYSQEMLEEQAGTMTLYSGILFQICFFLYLTYIINNIRLSSNPSFITFFKETGFICHLCMLIYITFAMLTGDRGPIIVIGVAYWGCYMMSIKDIKFIMTIALLVSGAYIISVLGITRNLDKESDFTDRFSEAMTIHSTDNSHSVLPTTLEYASSVNSLHYSVEAVPSKHPYLLGSFQLRQIFSTIPFANRLVTKFGDPHFRYRSSAFFVTWLIQGDFYTYGSGTSFNADLYLSFGVLGVMLGLLVWGCIYRYIEDYIDRNRFSIQKTIITLFFLAYSFYVCRASMLSFLNFMVFTFILNYLYKLVWGINNK